MSTQTRRSFASFTSAIVPRHVRGVPRLGAIIAAAGLLAALSLTGAAAAHAADAPVNPLSVSPISVTTKQGQAVTIQLLGSGPAGDQLFYGVGVALAVGFGPVATAHGSVAMETNTLFPSRAIYTPVAGFSGTDSFNYRVSDSAFDSPVATVTVTVTPVAADNHAPTATPGSFTVESQQQATFVPTGTDPDGDALAFAVVTPPAHGNLQIIPGQSTWYYDPTSGYSGSDSFTFTASDGALTSAPATVSITITPVRANTPPTSVPPNVVTAQDTPITFTITASDAENDPTEIDLESNVQHGTLTNDGAGHFTYTPTLGYSGSDSFLYFVSDFRSGSPDYLVSITVTPAQVPNHAPTVLPVSVGTQAAPVAVTLLGSDPDGDPLTYATAGGPTHGTLSGTGANLTYTPNAGFFGTDGFTYTASDGVHVSTPAAVQITVTSAGIPFTFPSVDVSVSTDQKQAAAKVVSPKLTTAGADRLLVAFVTVDGPTSATQKVSSVTGGGLTWSLVTRANSTWGYCGDLAGARDVEAGGRCGDGEVREERFRCLAHGDGVRECRGCGRNVRHGFGHLRCAECHRRSSRRRIPDLGDGPRLDARSGSDSAGQPDDPARVRRQAGRRLVLDRELRRSHDELPDHDRHVDAVDRSLAARGRGDPISRDPHLPQLILPAGCPARRLRVTSPVFGGAGRGVRSGSSDAGGTRE